MLAPPKRSPPAQPTVQPPSPRQLFAAALRRATFVEVGPSGSRGELVYADFSYLEVGCEVSPRYWVHVWDVRTQENERFYVAAERRVEFAACVMSNYLVSTKERRAYVRQPPVRLEYASFSQLP